MQCFEVLAPCGGTMLSIFLAVALGTFLFMSSEKYLAALVGPFSAAYFPICALSSGVYSLYFPPGGLFPSLSGVTSQAVLYLLICCFQFFGRRCWAAALIKMWHFFFLDVLPQGHDRWCRLGQRTSKNRCSKLPPG